MILNDELRVICKQQQELFEYAQKAGADVRAFAKVFLNSDFCNRSLDKPYSADQYSDIMNWLEFLELECIAVHPKMHQKNPVSLHIAGWLGFTYRQLQIETKLPSRELWKLVPIDRLIAAWPGLHTVDENMAAEIIIKDFRLTEYASVKDNTTNDKHGSQHDDKTGLPLDETYLEKGLPEYLQISLENMKRSWAIEDSGGTDLHWDIYWCDLNASINSAEVDQLISSRQAWYLRKKYLRMENDDE